MKAGPIKIWRGFFPSWKFFDTYGPLPRLFVRQTQSLEEIDQQSWQEWVPLQKLAWWSLLHNPDHNLNLFYDTLLRQLVLELQEQGFNSDRAPELTSFQILQRRLALELQSGTYFQFRLSMLEPGPCNAETSENEVLLLSPVFQASLKDHP